MIKNNNSKGVTLIELMVSLALGMILVFSMLAFYGALSRKISVQVRNQVEVQEYRNALNLLMNSIKNAGMFKCNRSEWLFIKKDLDGGVPILRFTVPVTGAEDDLRSLYDVLNYNSGSYPYHTTISVTSNLRFPWPISGSVKDCEDVLLSEKIKLKNIFIGISKSYSSGSSLNTYSAPDTLTFDSSGNATVDGDGAGKGIGYYGVFSDGATPWFETSADVDDPMVVAERKFIPTTSTSITTGNTIHYGINRHTIGFPLFQTPREGDVPIIEIFLGLAKEDELKFVPDSIISGTNDEDYKRGGWVKLTNDHIDALTLSDVGDTRNFVLDERFASSIFFNGDKYLFNNSNYVRIKPEYNRHIIAIKFNITVHPGKDNEAKLSKVVRFGTYLPTVKELVEEAESS